MKTTSRFPRLCGAFVRTVTVVLGLTFCVSAWADSAYKNVVAPTPRTAAQITAPHKKVRVYVFSTASAIPIPIEQVSGTFPTTTRAMLLLGRQDTVSR